ncbi:MAG: GDP-4-dehydro-6-deoxy-D-mannose reductase, partial [Actinomycetota bacterium]|nr:GDP-4-dehydro-6-deoxy-D-mannose reductase [Actinomycetota bacterium]
RGPRGKRRPKDMLPPTGPRAMAAGSLAPMRAFLTGGQGFVGTWLVRHLEEQGDEVTAPGPDVDITDAEALAAAVADARPEAIYHLAALANVSESWQDPVGTFEVNATGTLHLLEAARRVDPYPRVLLVCSAEVYGSVDPHRMPIVEDTPLRPVTPYAASKVAAEFLGMQAHLAYGLPVLRVRAFNHVGPSQAGSFVVSDLARGIAEAERNGTGVLRAGNLAAKRDFTDVRDVVRAYRLLVERGTAGEVYNVCSGRAVGVEELARRLLALAGVELTLETDPALARPVDVPVLYGDPTRVREAVGWEPVIALDDTLRDVLAEWRERVAVAP